MFLTDTRARSDTPNLQLRMAADYGPGIDRSEVDPPHPVITGSVEWAATAAARVVRSGEPEVLSGVRGLAGDTLLPGPLGEMLPHTAVVVPLTLSGRPEPIGAIALGINPYRTVDRDYRSSIELVGGQLRVALTDVDVHESEQRRLQLLADLDHARTVFCQNLSHELRTPLTLLLAPLQDLLVTVGDDLAGRADLLGAVRAAERLRGLVDACSTFPAPSPVCWGRRPAN